LIDKIRRGDWLLRAALNQLRQSHDNRFSVHEIILYLQPLNSSYYNDQQKKYPGKSNADPLYPGSAGTSRQTGRTHKDPAKAF
jgi:hypothetical protein